MKTSRSSPTSEPANGAQCVLAPPSTGCFADPTKRFGGASSKSLRYLAFPPLRVAYSHRSKVNSVRRPDVIVRWGSLPAPFSGGACASS
jgi:hypothetical protein